VTARVITITSGKGGLGKTTGVANLGVSLALEGKRVVVLDAAIGLRKLDVVMGLEKGWPVGFLDRLFKREPPSKEIAKERLQLVLVHDRQPLSPKLLQTIRDDIIVVISKHVDIDPENTKTRLTRGRGRQKLIADIPIRSPRRRR